ncbi:MAG: hypothetical protein KDD47_14945, partial [Acidobacteria bacterium]|nr:hypothetical protein [Acidobacteriota bacterium]
MKNPALLALLLVLPVPGAGQCLVDDECPGSVLGARICGLDVVSCDLSVPSGDRPAFCAGSGCSFRNCRNPTVPQEPVIDVIQEADGELTARLRFTVTAPWNQESGDTDGQEDHPNGTLDMYWYASASAPDPCDPQPVTDLCEYLSSDIVECSLEKQNLTCDGAPYDFGVFSFRAQVCGGPGICGFPASCGRWVDRDNLTFVVTPQMLGCPEPPPEDCNDGGDCKMCLLSGGAGGAGASAGGGGGSYGGGGPGETGPGAQLRYRAGGVGGEDFPGTSAWRTELGLYWSHDYSERIIQDPDDSKVWLLTKGGSFRKF